MNKKEKLKIKEYKNKNQEEQERYNKINLAKVMKNTKEDDERIISCINIRKPLTHEVKYLNKKLTEFDFKKINKSNYKNYCLGSRKYKNKIYSILSLYRMTNGKRSDFKYVIIVSHTKSNEKNAKLKHAFDLYIDFCNEPYFGNYYRLFKNEIFLNKIWKKIEKLHDKESYEKRKNK